MSSAKRSLFGKSLALFGATTVAGALVPLALAGAARTGALAGVVAAALASATALVLLALAYERGTKLLMGALAAGFMLRMLVVGAGLLSALALGADLMAFAVAFFALYLAHQIIELAVVVRARAAEGAA
jgi:hypothetical protein